MIEWPANILAKGAGATPLAAVYSTRGKRQVETVAIICPDGNGSLKQHLRETLAI